MSLLTSQAQTPPRQATSAQADAEECDGALEAQAGGRALEVNQGLEAKLERSTRPGLQSFAG